MSKAKPFLFGAALGASATFFALQYHVVHSHDGFQVVPRTPQQSVGLAYADIRSWSPSQWTDRPELARALMAHGSSDLIAESVASTLADSVTEDSSTLDELRTFLNSSEAAKAPGNDAAQESDSGKPDSGTDSDLFRIPFPQDARSGALADPFRVATTNEKVNETGVGANSRFSTNDVLEGLTESPGTVEHRTTRPETPASSPPSVSVHKTSTPGKSAAQQSQEMEERIFGKSLPASGSAIPQTAKSSQADQPKTRKPPVHPAESELMFEEVTTQLENRAQDALTRVQENPSSRATNATKSTTESVAGYVREKAVNLIPETAKSLLSGGASKAGGDATTPLIDFDPFLE